MKRFLKDYRLHEHTEALFLLTLGILIQVLDGSPFDVWDRWSLAWETEFPREFFSVLIQQIIKTVLSIIILVRCLTTVLYVLFGLIAIYCIIRETSPKLMLPWLFISGLKSVLLTFLETMTGVYVCSAFGKVRKPCIEFVVSKAIELFFAIYLWACIRSIHKDFEQYEEHCREEELLTKMVIHRVNLRRRRARSMIDESTLHKTSNLNNFGLKDVPNIIIDMLKTEDELSQDSLLSPGMMLASVSNMGSYDYLKTSLSLGELGLIDLSSFQVAGLDDYRHLSPSARAMKFLKLTREDIKKAKERTRSKTFAENYKPLKEIPRSLVEVKPSNILNRPPRQKEMFAATLPELDKVKEHLSKKKKRRTFQDDILTDNHDFDTLSQVEDPASAEQFIGLEEGDGDEEDEDEDNRSVAVTGETDGETTPNLWFMTNIKDQVNRIGLVDTHSSKRSDNYQRLYRQDYMSVIGAEVFDRASKLVKLTSLGDVNSRRGYGTDSEMVYPSTSRSPDPGTSEETIGLPKRSKTKKLAFENHFGGPTAMPLSVIVTNFPIHLDSRIPKCEAVYYRETVTSSAQILLLPDRTIDPRLEICDGDGSNSAMEEKSSESSNAAVLTTGPEDIPSSKGNQTRGTFAQAGDQSSCQKVNLFMLKCSRGTTPDFWYDRSCCMHESDLRTCRVDRDFAVFTRDERVMRSSRTVDEGFRGCDGSYIYPRISEQMMFIRDMMRRPIRDVLRSYYNLREAESDNPGIKRICSSDSVRFENGLTVKPVNRFDAVENLTTRNKSAGDLSVLEKKTFVDCGTQVSFGEDELKSTETVTLGSPKTKKLKTDKNEVLRPLYLFGNKDLGWSSSPLDVSTGRTQGKPKSNRKENEAIKKVATSSQSLPEGSTPKACTAEVANPTNSDLSCKMVLPASRRNACGKDSFSSAQEEVSLEVIPLSDDNPSICSAESDESFSLFYSKTADLASPLLDMRRFIYPDHIHYSYKNVKKKGFDVELNGGLPLLVRDSLTLNPSVNVKRMDTPPDPHTGIIRRPMDLTFANQDVFPKEVEQPGTSYDNGQSNHFEIIKLLTDPSRAAKPRSKTLKKEQKWLKKFMWEERARNPDDFDRELVDSSSTNLHSNKGRVCVMSNPAAILQGRKLKKKLQRSRLKNVAGTF